MANFSPLNDYMLYIFDKLILKYRMKGPFLDGGCGVGYVSKFLAFRGWEGKAIDLSAEAISITKEELAPFPKIRAVKEGILDQKGKFNTIILFDVIEHIKDDVEVLKKINKLLLPGGFLLLALTSNPREWRWDDEFYGHYRRYTERDIKEKLAQAKMLSKETVEYTFPFFWFIRRIYTAIQNPPKVNFRNKKKRTDTSAIASSWKLVSIFNFATKLDILWKLVFFVQYNFFRKFTSRGFAILVLAQK